jgi:hypothetical protein
VARELAERTRERDAARAEAVDRDCALDALDDLRAVLWPGCEAADAMTAEDVVREVRMLTERLGYYERSNVPRLLGLAPDQIEAVRAVLLASEAWESGRGNVDAIERAHAAWIAAGRPLASEEGERCE